MEDIELPNDYIKPVVKLVGEDGNAFSILGKVIAALKKSKVSEEVIGLYKKHAMSGDYEHLMQVSMQFCEVE